MMKWKARTETTNICDMSDSLKAEVDKAIEIAKVQYTEHNKALNAEKGYNLPTVWSDKPVIIDFTFLRVVLKAGEPITYTICIGFEQWDCDIAVDLSEYANELKKAIIKVLVDKFF